MKIIHLISGGDSGGAKTHVFTLLEALKEKVDIELVCLTDGPFYREAIELGIKSSLLEQSSRLDFSVLKILRKKLEDEKVDVLHCHGARANFVGALIKKKVTCPVITTMHSDYRQDFSHSLPKQLIFMPLNRYSLKRMDYFFSVTEVFKNMLIGQGFTSDKIRVIYNGIHTKHYDLKLLGDELVFGCVTTLRPIKGTHVLLEAISLLRSEGFGFKVFIAGGGTGKYVEDLHEYVKDNQLEGIVSFKGYVKDMDAFYDDIDVNILPSFTESFPYALLEGGIRKKGTIASDAGGIVEMIEDKKSGLLFPAGDAKALAECMKTYMIRPKLVHQLGQAFASRVEENFSSESMARRHVDLYEDIMNKE